MYIVHRETYNTRGEMIDHTNILAFRDFDEAKLYIEKLRSDTLATDRKLFVRNTGAGFIVNFVDGLQREFHYKCEKILVKGE